VLSRARGHRIVASAAAQSAARLRDQYYGTVHNHTQRPGVDFTEILAPADSPPWVFDREQLWNRVEAAELRKDSQLARALELSIPRELEPAQRVDLLREFLRAEFVSHGMIADLGIRRTQLDNPSAHVLLTLRRATAAGFGPKMRQWNTKANLLSWRASWANHANLHLARAGHRLRIDHRTLEAQQIELTPARKTGLGHALIDVESLPEYLHARFSEQRRIARANGESILEDPAIAIRALAHQRRSFTAVQLSQFLRSRTDGEAQHDAALSAVMASSELIVLGPADGVAQYTSRDLLEAEKSLVRRARAMASRRVSSAASRLPETAVPPSWSRPLREAYAHLLGAGDFTIAALPHEERAELKTALRTLWTAQDRRVLEAVPQAGHPPLTKDDVLILDGAHMIDLKSLERILAAAEKARAKLVLLADAEQLQAMGALSPMHELTVLGRRA